MKVKYKLVLLPFLLFLWYITLPQEQTEVIIYTFLFVVLIWGCLKNPKVQKKEPYIIGNSNKIEYLTSQEFEERLKKKF